MSLCPSMFEPILTQGGWLYRLRLVGGRVNSAQLKGILAWIKEGGLEITRRGNLQHRSFEKTDASVLQELQTLGLIGNRRTDHLRNIMLSPMAGIDRRGVDLSNLALEWENYLNRHPELKDLSAKFSVGFDGKETVSISSLSNDILVSAIDRFSLAIYLGSTEGIVVSSGEGIDVLKTIATLYLHYTQNNNGAPRLKEMVKNYGIDFLWQKIEEKHNQKYDRCLKREETTTNPADLPVYQQNDPIYSAISIFVPLGHLSRESLLKIKEITDRFGTGEVRFSPWYRVFIPFIHHSIVPECLKTIEEMGLSYNQNYNITACAGLSCNSSLTDPQSDALRLTRELKDPSFSIHLSGCNKLCAQSRPHDLTAIGVKPGVYALYKKEKMIGECKEQELLTNVKHFL